MSEDKKLIYKLSFGEWVLLVGGVLSVGSSHARIGFNNDGIRQNQSAISENKAFGIARDKKHVETREYARDYAYRKDMEIKVDVIKNNDSIHVIREENVEARVERSHLEKNQERMLKLLEELLKKQGK